MSTVESIDSLHATLEPLEALRGEHSQLEEWVNDSFQALEKLHEDLSVWQSELARKQTELDLREDSLDHCQEQGGQLDEAVACWKKDLETAREEVLQLDEENAEQLQALEELERCYAALEQELEAVRGRNEELAAALAQERERVHDEQHQWQDEFRQLRQLLQEQHVLLSQRLADEATLGQTERQPSDGGTEGSSRSAELRRRAEARRAAKGQKQASSGEPTEL